MRLLLDENRPHELRRHIVGHEVFTVAFMKWKGTKNGAVLGNAAKAGFDVFVTADSGVEYQQNQSALPISIVILEAKSNDIDDLLPLTPNLLDALSNIQPKTLVKVAV